MFTMENIGLYKADVQETKKLFRTGMIFQEYLIVQYLPLTASGPVGDSSAALVVYCVFQISRK